MLRVIRQLRDTSTLLRGDVFFSLLFFPRAGQSISVKTARFILSSGAARFLLRFALQKDEVSKTRHVPEDSRIPSLRRCKETSILPIPPILRINRTIRAEEEQKTIENSRECG